jgi:hypothetical protein
MEKRETSQAFELCTRFVDAILHSNNDLSLLELDNRYWSLLFLAICHSGMQRQSAKSADALEDESPTKNILMGKVRERLATMWGT